MPQQTNPYIRSKTTEIINFALTEEIKDLTKTQKVNQKVVLSFYGNKIDMPFKVITGFKPVKLTKELAIITDSAHEVIDSYKVEIEHPLGLTYFRMDVPKVLTASQMTGDAFAIAELNIQSKREFEDYLVNRKQYDLDFSTMDLGHRQARLARKYEFVSKGIDVALGTMTTAVGLVTGGVGIGNIVKASMDAASKRYASEMAEYTSLQSARAQTSAAYSLMGLSAYMPTTNIAEPQRKRFARIPWKMGQTGLALGVTAYKGASGLASGIAGLVSASERAALQEEGFGLEIQNKALQSYQIDLGYERQKQDQLLTMRRIFANETFNDISSRKRQQLLDKLEKTKVEDIYLEVWTTSGEQESFVSDYHDKFGVDCRLADKELYIRDEMPLGIYCIEDVIIENLSDRIDFEYLKARLTGGIKFVEWVEHELVKDLSPVDIRVQKIQLELNKEREKTTQLESTIRTKEEELAKEKQTSNSFQERFHQLSDDFRKKEAELHEQTNLAVLYKNESIHLKQDLLKESQKHAQEKEEHSGTKQEKENLEQEKSVLTSQVQEQLRELTQLREEKKNFTRQIQDKDKQKNVAIQNMNTFKRQKAQAEQKLKECQQSLEGVRAIETQLRERLRNQQLPDIWKEKCFTQIVEPARYVLTNCSDEDLYWCAFDASVFAWVKSRDVSLKASWNQKFLRADIRTENDWFYHNQKAQFGGNAPTKYKDYKSKMLVVNQTQRWAWQGNLAIRDETYAGGNAEMLPHFHVKPTSKEDKLVCPVYFTKETGFTGNTSGNKIETYGQYLDALGMDFIDGKVTTKKMPENG